MILTDISCCLPRFAAVFRASTQQKPGQVTTGLAFGTRPAKENRVCASISAGCLHVADYSAARCGRLVRRNDSRPHACAHAQALKGSIRIWWAFLLRVVVRRWRLVLFRHCRVGFLRRCLPRIFIRRHRRIIHGRRRIGHGSSPRHFDRRRIPGAIIAAGCE